MTQLLSEQQPADLSGADHIPVPAAARPAAMRKFILFSCIGILMFLIPIHWDGKWTIGLGILADALKSVIQDYLPLLATCALAGHLYCGQLCRFDPHCGRTQAQMEPIRFSLRQYF